MLRGMCCVTFAISCVLAVRCLVHVGCCVFGAGCCVLGRVYYVWVVGCRLSVVVCRLWCAALRVVFQECGMLVGYWCIPRIFAMCCALFTMVCLLCAWRRWLRCVYCTRVVDWRLVVTGCCLRLGVGCLLWEIWCSVGYMWLRIVC